MKATIAASMPLTTFVQTWTVTSAARQQELLATMRRHVGRLQAAPGFVSISLHPSEDGKRIAVYGQWRRASDMIAAVSLPEAKAAHDEYVQLGAADGGATYSAPDVYVASPEAVSSTLRAQAKARWAEQGFSTRMVQVNGKLLHVAEGGQGDPVVLLHGYPQSGEIWRRVALELAKEHRVIVPDLPGMGLSDPGGAYDLLAVAEELHQLASSMQLNQVKLAGHDWGASVAAVYALRYREEVSRLAFLESAVPGAGFETGWTFAQRNDLFTFIPFLLMGQEDKGGDITAELLDGREEIYLRHLWERFTGDKQALPFEAWAPYLAAISRPGLAASSASYYRAAYESSEQVKKLLARKIDIPVLPIAGGLGLGKNQHGFAAAFANRPSSAVILEGAGHFLAEERASGVASLLTKFFNPM